MKRFCLILMLAVGRLTGSAQTHAPEVLTVIHSDSFAGSLLSHHTLYTGHVRVDHPGMKLTCEWATTDSPTTNSPDTIIVARTNVVIDLAGKTGTNTNGAAGMTGVGNQSWHVTSDQAVYTNHPAGTVTNETLTISGHAIAKSEKETITGEPLIYDLVTKQFSGSNYEMVVSGAALPPAPQAKTNAAAVNTNAMSNPH